MFKLAFIAGIALEWLLGSPIDSAVDAGYASLRAFMLMLAAWIALEAIRLMVQAVQSLEP
jgi:hypothetical protein